MLTVGKLRGHLVTAAFTQATDEALGRTGRDDPVLSGTGGPAGNALLTAWTALVLLAGSAADC